MVHALKRFQRQAGLAIALLFSCLWSVTGVSAQPGALMHVNTMANSSKSNQSKVFYHDSKWWAIALDATNNRWYIWRYDGNGVWARNKALDKSAQNRYDALLHEATGKLSLVRSHTNATRFWSLTYNPAGTWNTSFTVDIPLFGNIDNNHPLTLAQASNGDFWVFRIASGKLEAKKSSDGGLSWSLTPITIKSTLNQPRGVVDAVAFSQGGNNYVGVSYGEEGVSGSTSRFGFLYHRDGDPDGVWTDESSLITYQGSEQANNQLSMTVDTNNNIYLLTRTFGGGTGVPRNTLYKRTNTGTWQRRPVIHSPAAGWTSPAIAIDTSTTSLILSGIRQDSSFAEYKIVAIGSEAAASSAASTKLLFAASNAFQNLTVPRQYVNGVVGMMVCAANSTTNDMWFNLFQTVVAPPVVIDSVTIESNQVNAQARYTIPIITDTLTGSLAAGAGTISLRFPNNTSVPPSLTPSLVTVNGTPASTVTTNATLREMYITTPIALIGGDTAVVVVDSLAGVINKTSFGVDSLQAWTSAQLTPGFSPGYTLVRTTTTVTAAKVTPLPTDPDSISSYTIGFHLGSRGRMLAGLDTFRVRFPAATGMAHGALSQVRVNTELATATADSAKRTISIVMPGAVTTANNDSITLFIPETALRNPDTLGSYTLFVSTSVETTQVASLPYAIEPYSLIGAPVVGTTDNFNHQNQSKLFHHGGFWWMAAQSKIDKDWHLWKFDGFNWTPTLVISNSAKPRPDIALNAAANKAYILLPGTGTVQLLRLSFSSGAWSIDSGYPKAVNSVQTDEMVLVRGLSGRLWVFWANDSTLYGQRSNNDGAVWSSPFVVKSNLNDGAALTDAVTFKIGGTNVIGFGYAENSSNNNVIYGFLRHKENDPDTLWIDETSSLPQPVGTSADNHICMATHNNEIFMVIKTKGGGGATTTQNALYHRTSGGAWSIYDINQDHGWTRPVVALDITNNVLYVYGTREGGSQIGEMKRVNFGDYGSLLATPIDTSFYSDTDLFFDSSGPAHPVTSATNLMIASSNTTRNEVWYNLLLLTSLPKTGGPAPQEHLAQGAIEDYKFSAEVYPNPFNPETTIRFRIDQPARVKLQIFNINGQLVRTLINKDLNPGEHLQRWNGRNQAGLPVSSGMYILRLQYGDRVTTARMQLLK